MPDIPEYRRLGNTSADQRAINVRNNPAQPKRTSPLSDHHVANPNNNGVRIETQQPLKVTQDKVKFFEKNRRYDRIVDIAHMLEANGALTKDEKDWLKDLGVRDYAKYCQLGDLLRVRMIGRRGHHGVWSVGDRNKIRMQTMKAVLYEAMQMYDPDGSWDQKMDTIDRALAAGKKVRNAMTRETPGPNLNMQNYVTKKTLLDPRIIYRKYNRKFANQWLHHDITWMQNIHADIGESDQKRVAKAVELLVVNDLLTAGAVLKLEDLLRKRPNLVSKLMKVNANRVQQSTDREKIRALTLLAYAYNSNEGAEYVKNWVQSYVDSEEVRGLTDKTRQLLQESGSGSVLSDPGGLERPAYEWLPPLPLSGNASGDLCNMWLIWAKQVDSDRDIKTDIPADKNDNRFSPGMVAMMSGLSDRDNLNKPLIEPVKHNEPESPQKPSLQRVKRSQSTVDKNAATNIPPTEFPDETKVEEEPTKEKERNKKDKNDDVLPQQKAAENTTETDPSRRQRTPTVSQKRNSDELHDRDGDVLDDDIKSMDDVPDQEDVSDDKTKDKQLPFQQMGPVGNGNDEVKTDETSLEILPSKSPEEANIDGGKNAATNVLPIGLADELKAKVEEKRRKKDKNDDVLPQQKAADNTTETDPSHHQQRTATVSQDGYGDDIIDDDMNYLDDVPDQEDVSDDKTKDKQLPFQQMGPVANGNDEVKTDETAPKILPSKSPEEANIDGGKNAATNILPIGLADELKAKVEEKRRKKDKNDNMPPQQTAADNTTKTDPPRYQQTATVSQNGYGDDFLDNDLLDNDLLDDDMNYLDDVIDQGNVSDDKNKDEVKTDETGLKILRSENAEEAIIDGVIRDDKSPVKPVGDVSEKKNDIGDAKADETLKAEPKIFDNKSAVTLNKSLSPSTSDDADLNEMDNVNRKDNVRNPVSSEHVSVSDTDYDLNQERLDGDDDQLNTALGNFEPRKGIYALLDDNDDNLGTPPANNANNNKDDNASETSTLPDDDLYDK